MAGITLYFAQHGLAVDKTDNPLRPLSKTGIEQTSNIARMLRDKAAPVSHVFHSGKLRAAETADIFAQELQARSVTAVDYLSPNDDATQTTDRLTTDNALFIGHLPHLEKLIAHLLTGDESNSIIKFRNSAVACLHKQGDNYQLHWYLTPAICHS